MQVSTDSMINHSPLTMPAHAQDGQTHGRDVRLAYLLSSYPAISHTFFLNEITELRKLGFSIDVASINKPTWSPDMTCAQEASALETTFYIKEGNIAYILWTLLKIVLKNPGVVARGLRCALQLDGWNLPGTAYALFYFAEALLLGDWLRRRDHQHLHVHFGGPVATVGMLTSKTWLIPYSLMIHGPEEFYDVDKLYLRQKLKQAEFVFCISDYARSQIMKVSDPAHWGKLHVVRLGVDLRTFAPASRIDRVGAVEIICVGRLVADKGHMVLLGAFADLRRRGFPVILRLVGDGAARCTMEAFVTQEKLNHCVIFEGALNHEATRQKLGDSDIFVLASFAEGLPVALMEAMAMGIPCVSTFVAGIPELIRDGMDGLLVPPSSEQALSTALEHLITNADLRRKFAASGRERVRNLYDLGKNVLLLAKTFRSCLSASRQHEILSK
jgi:colanic acid/amylovoran biosynthesis glycosyltransferase